VSIELRPKLLKLTKFKSLLLSVGDKIKCEGVLLKWLFLFFCRFFQNVFDEDVCSLAFEYFIEFPTKVE
jgi:hypothetical protein